MWLGGKGGGGSNEVLTGYVTANAEASVSEALC